MNATAQTWVFVAAAGAAGTLLRYVAGGWLANATGGRFPWETLAINVFGCLAIGVVAGAVDRGALLPPSLRTAIMVGFLGGFTTFSTFALEALRLASGAEWPAAASYVFGTNVVGLVATWAGYRAALLA